VLNARSGAVCAALTISQACKWTSSYLIERQSRSMNTLSRQQPLPSIEDPSEHRACPEALAPCGDQGFGKASG